jgi:predicted DNA-binding protein
MEKTIIEVIKEANELLIKQSNEIKILINALERIKDWDDEMHNKWDDCGEFASFTLKTYNQNK